MDEDILGRIGDAGMSIKDYEACKIFCENRFTRMQSRVAGKTLPKDSDKMVYGVDAAAPQAPPAQPAPEPATAEFTAANDTWTDSQDPWTCQPCTPEAQVGQWHLDPFDQKGGGKKGARPPMA